MRERFIRAWQSVGARSDMAPQVYREVQEAYREPARHYHTLEHIQECVDLYEGVRDHASQEYEVELAIFLHDVIYDPTRFDNEARSAEWAHTRLKQAEVEGAVVERIVSLIVSTKEHAPDLQGDHALLSDIDLAILGARPERYREYQRQVRAEYAFVPQVVFDQARRAFLSKMLERESIFHTCEIRQKCGDQAESNLQAALHELPQPNNE